jgi:glyceraldehyde 3-phosphate dehydrogenase
MGTPLRIGINGLGRIGRCVVRALFEGDYKGLELVAVNGPADSETHRHLLQYDSVHGRFRGEVQAAGDALIINGKRVALLQERDPAKIDWDTHGVELVLECTGKFNERAGASQHLRGSVQRVLISAPSGDADATIVYGVNHAALKPEHRLISVGSCTTNCLAPVAKVLHDSFGIEIGFMTTVHAYTGDQNLIDGSHKDLRRARAAALSMIPSSTGAAKAIGLVLPELAGKLDGTAIRVPTPNVSMVDLCFTSAKPISVKAIHGAIQQAAKGAMQGVLAYTEEPLVSIDFTHHPASSVFDATGTKVMGDRFARIASWYDNEWGFSNRMLDIAAYSAGIPSPSGGGLG